MKVGSTSIGALLVLAACATNPPADLELPTGSPGVVVVSPRRLDILFRWDSSTIAWPSAPAPRQGPPVAAWTIAAHGVRELSVHPPLARSDSARALRELFAGADAAACNPPQGHNVMLCVPVRSSVGITGQVISVTVLERSIVRSWRAQRPHEARVMLWTPGSGRTDTLVVQYR